jgi:hypothetical protein
MPIAFGLPCPVCGALHLINRRFDRARMALPSRSDCVYGMDCMSCGKRISLSKHDLKAYTVSSLSFTAGCAKRGQYAATGLVPKTTQSPNRYQTPLRLSGLESRSCAR